MTDMPHTGDLPAALTGYRCVSCLKAGARAATYLAESAKTGARVIVKVSDDPDDVRQIRNEARLMGMIRATGRRQAGSFPAVERLVETDGQAILVRAYIPGQTVDACVETRADRPGMPAGEALACTANVLELLSFLHNMDPPVIHRDIKPQNIVIAPDGQCHLIDLGISRLHSEDDDMDTRVMGTRLTAPPEQFGYRQTDARSDIYSAGVLLRYCLTGEYGEDADRQLPRDIRRIIERATMFDPALRYQRAEDMLRAIRRLQRAPSARKRKGRAAAAFAAIAVCLLTAFFAAPGGHFDLRGVYHFREPLIERAVRQALGEPSRGLTQADLGDVTSIVIFGKYIASQPNEFCFLAEYTLPYYWSEAGDLWLENGGISSLQDIPRLTGLETLGLYRQEIRDIGALKDTGVVSLGLGFNPLSDLTPLGGNASIRTLNLTCLPLSDIDVLSTLPELRSLDLDGTQVRQLDPLAGLPIETLNLVNTACDDYDALTDMHAFSALSINKTPPALVDALAQTGLDTLIVTGEDHWPLETLDALKDLERLDYRTSRPTALDGSPMELPGLKELTLRNVSCTSFMFLSPLASLESLDITECAFESCAGLDALPALRNVTATEAQAAAIDAAFPGHVWEYAYPHAD